MNEETMIANSKKQDILDTIEFMREEFPNARSIEFVLEFPMLHIGWEMDNVCYIIDVDNVPLLVFSNHGSASWQPYSKCKELLESKIEEYERAAKLTRDALVLLR